ncbi:hypothetical protein B7494_g7071 [Chlorociboria aeruginascens]|nr:hypothetical protein B7494_g7071 [Chlorociboria aeruginascens]
MALTLYTDSVGRSSQVLQAPLTTLDVESRTGGLFCQMCDDFVWDPTLEELRMRKIGTGSFSARKRKHDELFTDAVKEDPRFISTNTVAAPCRASGVRGIYNMGATCYMNVILQSFVHNPLLRNFYLGDGHHSGDCRYKNCMSCAMDDMFQDFYAQETTTGYSASNILASFWLSKRKAYEELASNKEQDAHEFFQFLTEELHEINGGGRPASIEESPAPKRAKPGTDCKCIVHQTFYGKLQSTITCQKCGDINTSVESFLDLSLGLDVLSKKRNLKSATLTLERCLDEEYIRPERCEYTCYSCGTQEAKKQLSIKSLPNVLCIQLKRFKQNNGVASKIDTKVQFPLQLHMLPYTNRARAQDTRQNFELARSCTYDLQSVVVHVGNLETGHYVSYSRVGNQWFKFNDHNVTLASKSQYNTILVTLVVNPTHEMCCAAIVSLMSWKLVRSALLYRAHNVLQINGCMLYAVCRIYGTGQWKGVKPRGTFTLVLSRLMPRRSRPSQSQRWYGHGSGHNDDAAVAMGEPFSNGTVALSRPPASYFQYGESWGWMLAHIVLMTLGWLFILPIGVMLSISRSRFCLPVQFTFLVFNAGGILCGTVYNAGTPDLYPNNAHHKLGWWLTWIVSAQVILGVIRAYAGLKDGSQFEEEAAFVPISTEAMAEHLRMDNLRLGQDYRFSNDSGQGTEPNTASLRSQSISSSAGNESPQLADMPQAQEELDPEPEKLSLLHGSRMDQFFSKNIPGLLSARVLRAFQVVYGCVDRLILILGSVALTTGLVTYGGLFMGPEIFSGLAHFIKGGVFFWYGILTLGRWAGCFANIGWAWNIKPSRKSNKPSAEFVESFLIFFYGFTNVFLEHLAAWGSEWSAQDLEHISITVMFFGGGLCGMLIESRNIRELLNITAEPSNTNTHSPYHLDDQKARAPPESYKISTNPMPALIVLLLGLMMSSHHQESMVSTMIHKQWGTLLAGAAFARAATYVVFYISPPTSILPGRPPSELITAFCLMAGGVIFMASSKDTVQSMELHDLDAMFVFTVAMGMITFLMAWIVLVIAIKGWAVRKEQGPTVAYQNVA